MFDPYHKWLGIPHQEQPPHHYRLLGINLFEGDPDVIESAANRQTAHVRTYCDGPHQEAAQQILDELAAARLCLLDPVSRQAYDRELRAEKDHTGSPFEQELAEMARGAIRYAVLEAEHLWIAHFGLPAANRTLGEEVVGEGRFRDELAGLYGRLEEITRAYGSLHPNASEIRETDRGGRFSKPRRRAASSGTVTSLLGTLRLWLAALVYRYRRRAVLRGIGREAFAAYQDASGSERLTASIRVQQARATRLQEEIGALSELPTGRLLNAQRLAWLLGCLLLLPVLVLLWLF